MTDQTSPRWILIAMSVTLLLGIPTISMSQSPPPMDQEEIIRNLNTLIKMRQEMSNQMQDFDRCIQMLEQQLNTGGRQREPVVAGAEPKTSQPDIKSDTVADTDTSLASPTLHRASGAGMNLANKWSWHAPSLESSTGPFSATHATLTRPSLTTVTQTISAAQYSRDWITAPGSRGAKREME